MNVVHNPWVGARYKDGVAGRSILIVGNSHWLAKDEPDSDAVTLQVLKRVVDRRYDIAFFNHVRNYFGYENHADFWPMVAFMNFAPWAVGEGERRYSALTGKMALTGKARLVDKVRELAPDLVFVFSRKIQWALPEMEYDQHALPLPAAKIATMPGIPRTRVVLMRHPQGAPKRLMTEAVSAALALPRTGH